MSEEKKVIHEVKLDKSIIKLLWVFAVVLLLNALPKDVLIPEAFADLSSNPTITLLPGEAQGTTNDLNQNYPDGRLYPGGIDIDD